MQARTQGGGSHRSYDPPPNSTKVQFFRLLVLYLFQSFRGQAPNSPGLSSLVHISSQTTPPPNLSWVRACWLFTLGRVPVTDGWVESGRVRSAICISLPTVGFCRREGTSFRNWAQITVTSHKSQQQVADKRCWSHPGLSGSNSPVPCPRSRTLCSSFCRLRHDGWLLRRGSTWLEMRTSGEWLQTSDRCADTVNRLIRHPRPPRPSLWGWRGLTSHCTVIKATKEVETEPTIYTTAEHRTLPKFYELYYSRA